FGGLKSGSRVVPFLEDEDCYNKDVEVSNPIDDFSENHKDDEDLSLIREQLLQIENQQSNLLDLLQVNIKISIFLLSNPPDPKSICNKSFVQIMKNGFHYIQCHGSIHLQPSAILFNFAVNIR